MKYVVTHDGQELEVELERRDDGRYDARVGGRTLIADLHAAGGASLYSLLLDSEAFEISVVSKEDATLVSIRGRELALRVESEQAHNARLVGAPAEGERSHVVRAQMPGIVSRVLVRAGEDVNAGTPLLILEAMKMENEVRAVHAGRVERIQVKEGQTIDAGAELVVVGPSASEA